MTVDLAPAGNLSPAVVAELRTLAANPGIYPLQRLARAVDGGAVIPSAAAGRRARELRDTVLGLTSS